MLNLRDAERINKKVDIYCYPKQINKPCDNTEATIGDLHANALLQLYFLVERGVFTIAPRTYWKFADLFSHVWKYKIEKGLSGQDLLTLSKVFQNIKVTDKKVTVRFLGDTLCDRGPTDWFILNFFKKLASTKNIDLRILISNHDIEFLRVYEDFKRKYDKAKNKEAVTLDTGLIEISSSSSQSLHRLKAFLDKNPKFKQEFIDIVENCYKPALRVVDYTLHEDKKTLGYHAHTMIGAKVMQAAAKQMNVTYEDLTPLAMARFIDNLNLVYQKTVQSGDSIKHFNTYTAFNEAANSYGCGRADPYTNIDPEKYPFVYAIWSRKNVIDWPKLKDNYCVYHVHGHDSDLFETDVCNLDGILGKPVENRKTRKLDYNYKGSYKILYAKSLWKFHLEFITAPIFNIAYHRNILPYFFLQSQCVKNPLIRGLEKFSLRALQNLYLLNLQFANSTQVSGGDRQVMQSLYEEALYQFGLQCIKPSYHASEIDRTKLIAKVKEQVEKPITITVKLIEDEVSQYKEKKFVFYRKTNGMENLEAFAVTRKRKSTTVIQDKDLEQLISLLHERRLRIYESSRDYDKDTEKLSNKAYSKIEGEFVKRGGQTQLGMFPPNQTIKLKSVRKSPSVQNLYYKLMLGILRCYSNGVINKKSFSTLITNFDKSYGDELTQSLFDSYEWDIAHTLVKAAFLLDGKPSYIFVALFTFLPSSIKSKMRKYGIEINFEKDSSLCDIFCKRETKNRLLLEGYNQIQEEVKSADGVDAKQYVVAIKKFLSPRVQKNIIKKQFTSADKAYAAHWLLAKCYSESGENKDQAIHAFVEQTSKAWCEIDADGSKSYMEKIDTMLLTSMIQHECSLVNSHQHSFSIH